MAGGTWTSQNKVRPGAYINFKSKIQTTSYLGERGIATLPLILPFGPEKQMIEINADTNLVEVLGINMADDEALLIREVLKRARTALIYRLNNGDKATAAIGSLTVKAKYSGTKGNDITIVIQTNIEDITTFDILTYLGSSQVDKQISVKTISDLVSNPYVEFIGNGDIQTTAGIKLANGKDGTVTNQDYTDYFSAAELYSFNTMGIATDDLSLKSIAKNFIKRLRDQEGVNIQVVINNYPEADHEGVISVKNGVKLADGTILDAKKAVAYVTGATAGANINKSNTYTPYDGAVDVDKRYNNTEIIEALNNGEIIFTINNGKVVIEQDINTLKTFTQEKQNYFRKNRVVRTLDAVNNATKALWNTRYIGQGNNNEDGRNLFKKDVIKLLEDMQGIGALENVIPEDVGVYEGNDKDAVLSKIAAQPVDSPEKLYMEVEVQ